MKISNLAVGGTPGVNLSNQQQSTDRIAVAKAIAAGETPIRVTQSENNIDPQVERARLDIKKIKMRTNRSPDRFNGELEEAPDASAISDTVVPAQVVEDTKPLSPQVAAIAKERRAIQRERMELENLRKELTTQKPSDGSEELISRLKSKPLSVLQEYGVTYDQLTEAILSQSDGINPEIQNLKAEIKALKEGVDKSLSDRDLAAKAQVLAEMQREATAIASQGDDFELVREEGRIPDVIKLIDKTYESTGEVLDVSEAMVLVEEELLKDNLKRAQYKKIQSKLTPPQTQQPVQQKQNYMKTLTNRDSSSVGLSRRERAIMAMRGTLTKG